MPPADDALPPLRRRLLPNVVIVVFLGLQVAAGLKVSCPPKAIPALEPLRVACAPELWPFLEYNMYNSARWPGEVHHAYELVAEHADGREEVLSPARIGESYYDLRGRAIKGLIDGSLRRTERTLAAFLAATPSVRALRLEADRYRIEEDGTLTELSRAEIARHEVVDGRVLP